MAANNNLKNLQLRIKQNRRIIACNKKRNIYFVTFQSLETTKKKYHMQKNV